MRTRLLAALTILLISGIIVAALWAYPSAKLTPFKGDIIFSHELHVVANGVECATCHGSIDTSAHADDFNLPAMDVCEACHSQVSEDTSCGMCHVNKEEPTSLPRNPRPIAFNHSAHVNQKIACAVCHSEVEKSREATEKDYPVMADCMVCHDGAKAPDKCELCHENRITLADIHPVNWRIQHAQSAVNNDDYCGSCHRNQEFCIACHRGDNTQGKIHDLNFGMTHGVQAKGKTSSCMSCHDSRTFCNECHQTQMRIPLEHSTSAWRMRHGDAAREDIENCQSCHDSDDPTCANVGCHRDTDGIKGSNPSIHGGKLSLFDEHGPWHGDDGYFCFQCHNSTRTAGQGFCGYCHGEGE